MPSSAITELMLELTKNAMNNAERLRLNFILIQVLEKFPAGNGPSDSRSQKMRASRCTPSRPLPFRSLLEKRWQFLCCQDYFTKSIRSRERAMRGLMTCTH